jgi:hypothetical protein
MWLFTSYYFQIIDLKIEMRLIHVQIWYLQAVLPEKMI